MIQGKKRLWKTLSPTPNQQNAINTYNRGYGVNIHALTKQDAHDVISQFVPVQMLLFTKEGYIKGTTVRYDIVDKHLFASDSYNKWVREHIVIKDDKMYLKAKNNTNNLLDSLNKGMDKMLSEPSFSEFEDDLGYLSPGDLEDEMNSYGTDPMWWE